MFLGHPTTQDNYTFRVLDIINIFLKIVTILQGTLFQKD